MTQITFPIREYLGSSPSKQLSDYSPDIYALIWCLGEDGNNLQLIFLRPDTTQRVDSLGRVLQASANSYDPVAKQGYAYFSACEFDWQYALLTSGKPVQAQVDDVYPGGNRIFTDVTMPAPSQTPVPDVMAWLNQHMNVYSALRWNEPNAGAQYYQAWPPKKQTDFLDAFAAAWNHQPMALDDPPPNLANYDTDGTVFDVDHAWRLFCAHAAYSLAVEIGSRVPWTITGYNSSDLQLLLQGWNMFTYNPALNGYSLQDYIVPAPPEFTWAFLSSNDLIGVDRVTTIGKVLNWCRNNLRHISGHATAANMTAYWGYAGAFPVSRVIQGTVCTTAPEVGVRHYTTGCWGTTAFLQAVLRTVNIPVESVMGGGHMMPHFTTDDLYLGHGDDPYSFDSKCTPPYDAQLLLIDRITFDSWFGAGVPSTTAENNVDRQAEKLAVENLPDGLLHLYYLDQQAGSTPQNGQVYNYLQRWYPNFNDLYPDLWQRLDKKLSEFGYASQLFASWVPPLPPGCRDFLIRRLYRPFRVRGVDTGFTKLVNKTK